jgi:hypothetical protein
MHGAVFAITAWRFASCKSLQVLQNIKGFQMKPKKVKEYLDRYIIEQASPLPWRPVTLRRLAGLAVALFPAGRCQEGLATQQRLAALAQPWPGRQFLHDKSPWKPLRPLNVFTCPWLEYDEIRIKINDNHVLNISQQENINSKPNTSKSHVPVPHTYLNIIINRWITR